MSVSKSSQTPTTATASFRRSASIETFTSGDKDCRCSLESAAPTNGVTDSTVQLIGTASSPKRGFLGKLKGKLVVSKADLEAERQRKEIERQKFLARRDKRREEVKAEPKLEKDGEPNLYDGLLAYTGNSREPLWVPGSE